MIDRRRLLLSTSACALSLPLARSRLAMAQGRPGFFKAKDIAEAGYIYGLPIVMDYGVLYEFVIDKNSGQYKGPFNSIYNEARTFTWQDTAVVTPNSDTPYSMLWVDLRAEPVVISVPAIDPRRYYSIQLIDGNTFNYGYIGSRATGSEAGDYMIAGPHWTGARPPGIKQVFRATTQFGLTIFRTQLFDASDIENVRKVQAAYKAQPLSAFLKQPAPPSPETVAFPVFTKELAKTNFFEFLDFKLQFAPALPEEFWIREQLARIGVGPGKTFNFRDLPIEEKAEILIGLEEGKRKVDEATTKIGAEINGWRVGSVFGNANFFHGDWLLRATAAQMGIYGNDADEAMYPATRVDSGGQNIDCSKNNYSITFAKDQLPPVNAFWSVTMYDGKSQLLIRNPIDRYLINSPMLANMKRNGDGSLTIFIQNKTPGADKESNWLPAPEGPVYLVMRLYWPKTGQPSILPAGQGSWRPPGVVRA
ncbi:MAG: DUF1254 domain-containing protein [Beijerinckiaceae bacterium]|nr:DUF1254 domain-containing protein [Beijerinckiaceae bacterium]